MTVEKLQSYKNELIGMKLEDQFDEENAMDVEENVLVEEESGLQVDKQ